VRIAELCAGYGGLALAAKILHPDVELAWVCETDPDATKILQHNHPETPNHGDITRVDWAGVAPVDLLAAGFPCQPFSLAGKQRGGADERHLWPTGVLPAIETLRPRRVWLENVPGLLASGGGSVFKQILSDLCRCGYTVRWQTTGACAVGACHHRHRVFVHATLDASAPPDDAMFGLPIQTIRKWSAAGMAQGGEYWEMSAQACGAADLTLPTPTARDAERGSGWGDRVGRPLSEVIAMLPTPVASDHTGAGRGLRAAGGVNLRTVTAALLPTPTARLGDNRTIPAATLAAARINSGRRNLDDSVALLPTPRASDGAKGGPNQRGSSGDLALPSAVQPERWGNWAQAVARHESHTSTHAPAPTETGIRGGRRLSPAFVEWMMTLPPGWVTDVDISRTAQIKALGNGVVPLHAAVAFFDLGARP